MDDADVLMVERRGCFGLVNETLLGFRVSREIGREELQGDRAVELEVLGFVNNAHASAAEVLEDLVVGNRLTNECSHDSSFRKRDEGKLPQNKWIVKRDWGEGLITGETGLQAMTKPDDVGLCCTSNRCGVNGTPSLTESLYGKPGELRKDILEFGPETVACAE
jgi:hypothetical protein